MGVPVLLGLIHCSPQEVVFHLLGQGPGRRQPPLRRCPNLARSVAPEVWGSSGASPPHSPSSARAALLLPLLLLPVGPPHRQCTPSLLSSVTRKRGRARL